MNKYGILRALKQVNWGDFPSLMHSSLQHFVNQWALNLHPQEKIHSEELMTFEANN